MDELGSSIRHSDTNANVCCASFFFEPSQTMFTLLYPIARIEQPYSELFRNFVYDNSSTLDRNIKLLPWQRVSFRKTALRSLTIDKCPEIFRKKLQDNVEIFEECHKNDLYDLPPASADEHAPETRDIFQVYTDQELVREFLTDEHYRVIDDPEAADILFVKKPLGDFRRSTLHHTFINQFPFENIITNKELLALVCRRWKSLYGYVRRGSWIANDCIV